MSFNQQSNFNNPNLPRNTPYQVQILARGDLKMWVRGDPLNCLQSGGLVQRFVDLTNNNYFFEGETGEQVALQNNVVAKYPAANFLGGQCYLRTGPEADYSQPFTQVFCVYTPNPIIAGFLLARYQDATNQMCVDIEPNVAKFFLGAASVSGPIVPGAVNVIIASSSGANSIKVRTNGVTANGASSSEAVGSGFLALGSLYPTTPVGGVTAKISDVMTFQADLLDPANQSALALVEQYFTYTYGLTFTPAVAP